MPLLPLTGPNIDQKRRFRDTESNQDDDQITLGLGLLFTLQGIPCVYCGTEQGLNGTDEVYKANAGYEDWMVREALWGRQGDIQDCRAQPLPDLLLSRGEAPERRKG